MLKPHEGPDSTRKYQALASDAQILRAYAPLHRAFLVTACAYYIYVTIGHFIDQTGPGLAMLATLSVLTAAYAGMMYLLLKSRQPTRLATEMMIGVLHLLMLANVAGFQLLHFDQARLVYFTLLALAFGVSAISVTAAVVAVLVSVIAMLGLVMLISPDLLGTYIFIAISTTVVAVGLSVIIGGVVRREVGARLAADEEARRARLTAAVNVRLATTDHLTGLPNRNGFLETLRQRLQAKNVRVAVGVIDLVGFRAINDVFGYATGDRVLEDVARRLQCQTGLQTTFARLGGDEFGVVIADCPSEEVLAGFADTILACLAAPYGQDSVMTSLAASCGFAFADSANSAENLLDCADFAMREAKEAGWPVSIFSADHGRRIAMLRELERQLLQADLRKEIMPVYQPVVDGTTGAVLSFEALARWHSPELGVVSPADFIPLAEQLGVVPMVTQAVTRHSLNLLRDLPDEIRISVNLSPHDLASAAAVSALLGILDEAPEAARRLDFEVTESAVMRDVEDAADVLTELVARGARIALDDFGTGHSSLSRIRLMPLDCIKIDRSFIESIERDATSQAIVKTTLDLSRNLEVTCIVEGVETEGQLAALQALGARHFQGFHFGRPRPAAEVIAAIAMPRLRA